jgi:hypothetical protein
MPRMTHFGVANDRAMKWLAVIVAPGSIAMMALVGCDQPPARPVGTPPQATPFKEALRASTLPPDSPEPSLPTPTPAPTLIPRDAQHPVVLSIADAEREVLSWAVPANEARIERSRAVTVADFLANRAPGAGSMALAESRCLVALVDDKGGMADPSDCQVAIPADRVLTLVEASQRGMDMMIGQDLGDERPSVCWPLSSRSRARFVAFFDATRGQYLGMDFITDPYPTNWLDQLAEAPTVKVLDIGSPTPTPTASLTPVPLHSPTPYPTVPNWKPRPTLGLPEGATEERKLEPGEVPAPVVDAAREMAEVPGSRWVYQVTRLDQGVHWSQHVVTETIASAWRIAPDVMMVRRRECWSPGMYPYGNPPEVTERCRDEDRYYVLPNGRATGDSENYYASPLAALRKELEGTPSRVSGRREIVAQLRVPLRANQEYGDPDVDWSTRERAPIDAPYGHFDSCYAVLEEGSAGSTTHWTCPGVGEVRREVASCSQGGGAFWLYELIDYHIPPIVPVP